MTQTIGQPNSFRTERDEIDKPSFGETFSAVADNDWYLTAAYRAFTNNFERDYDYSPTDEEVTTVAERHAVPPEYFTNFARAENAEHLDAIAARIRKELDNEEIISNSRMGSRLAINVVDPVNLVTALGTGGTVGYANALRNVGLTRTALRSGTAVAAQTAVMESARITQSETQGIEDVTYATAGAFLLGGLSGSLGHAMTPENRKAAVNAVTRQMKTIEDRIGTSSSTGAAQVVRKAVPDEAKADADLLDEDVAKTSRMLGLRFDNAAVYGQDDNVYIRQAGSWLFKDHLPKADGSATPFAAEEWKGMIVGSANKRAFSKIEPAYQEWKKAGGSGSRDDFMEEVSRAVRNPEAYSKNELDAPILKAANGAADFYDDMLRELKHAGIADDIPPDRTYVPWVPVASKVRGLESEFGSDAVDRLIFGALDQSGDETLEELSEEALMSIARKYRETVRELDIEDNVHRYIADPDEYKAKVLDALEPLDDIDDATKEIIAELVSPSRKRESAGDSPRLKRRIAMNRSYKMPIEKDGEIVQLRIDDLVENNMETLMSQYANTIGGWAAISRATDGKIKKRSDWDAFKKKARSSALDDDARSTTEINEKFENLDRVFEWTIGAPLHKGFGARVDALMDMIGKYGFVRVMNQTAFSMSAELGSIMASQGFVRSLKHFPEAARMYRKMKAGDITEEDAWATAQLFNTGQGMLLNRRSVKAASSEANMGEAHSKSMVGARDVMRRMSNVTARIGGVGTLNDIFQEVNTLAFVGKVAYRAKTNKKLFGSAKRQAALGIDDAMEKRIATTLRKIADDKGRLDTSKVTDHEAMDMLVMAVQRETDRVVQRPSLGGTRTFMHSPIARLALQFRMFGIQSYTNHMMYGLSVKDMEAFNMWLSSVVFAGLGYAAQQYIRSTGRADRDEYLEKTLDPKAIGLAAYYRSSHASFLPGMVDTGSMMLTGQPVFGPNSRSTGLSQDALFGNPTTDVTVQAMNAVGGGTRALIDPADQYSQSQLKNALGLLPYQNAVPFVILQNKIMADSNLPEYSAD